MVGNASKRPAGLSRLLTDPMLMLWALASVVAAPILLLLKLRRYLRNRFVFEFNSDRWWVKPLTPDRLLRTKESGQPHVVFVGGGIGELQMIDRVAKELLRDRPNLNLTYCFRDPTTLQQLQQRPDINVAHWPFDFLIPVATWLRIQQPDLIVFTERFRFTTFSCAAARLGIQVALMNGRCRPRTSLLYKLAGFVYRWQFSAFKVMAMQRQDYFERARTFASPDCRLVLTGDLKADLSETRLEDDRKAEIREWLASDQPILAAGSTENSEEDAMVLEAYKKVRDATACRLLIAPRQLARRGELLKLVAEAGLKASLRTCPTTGADVFILDTLGELRFAYSLCAAAYVGGAYGYGGGHNVMEPLEWGLPVSYGMNRGYFEALQKACERAGVGTRVANSDALAAFWQSALSGDREATSVRASDLLASSRGAVKMTVELLSDLLAAQPGQEQCSAPELQTIR